MKVDRYKNHNIEVVIDKLAVRAEDEERLRKSVATAMKQGEGMVMVIDKDTLEAKNFSKRLMDPITVLRPICSHSTRPKVPAPTARD